MKEIFLNYSIFFLIYGFLGWIVEVIFTGVGNKRFVNRGFLFSPFLPIYAFGAVFLIITLSDYINNVYLLYIAAVMSTTIIEYIAALFLENVFHVKWWDYSKYKINFQGRVCLRNSLLFGFLGVFVMLVVQPPIKNFVENTMGIEQKHVVVTIYFTALVLDLYFTLKKLNTLHVRSMDSINKKQKNKQDKEAKLPDLFNGKYSNNNVNNELLNMILGISVLIGLIFIFLINTYFGIFIMLIFFIALYGIYGQKQFKKNK